MNYHLSRADPHVRPAPNASSNIRSFFFILFCLFASLSAIGTEADDVLPYFSIFIKTFSAGRLSRLAMAWIILEFAWWDTRRSRDSPVRLLCSRAVSAASSRDFTAILKIMGGIVVVWLVPNLRALYAVIVGATILSFFVARKLVKNINGFEKVKKVLKHKLKSPFEYIKKRSVMIPFWATLGLVGMINVDVMLVKKFFTAGEVGLYAGLALLGKIILYFSAPLSAVAYTFFTGSESKQNGRKILFLTTLLLIGIGGVALAGYTFFPELVISIVFGEKFLGIAEMVQLAAVFGATYSLASLFSQYFIAKGHPLSLFSLVALVGQVVGIVLYHDSFAQVLWVGIIASGGLLVVYLGSLVFEYFGVLVRLKKILLK